MPIARAVQLLAFLIINMLMKRALRQFLGKAVSILISISVIFWSMSVPLGALLYPQFVMAAGPQRVASIPPNQSGVPLEALVDIVFDQPINTATVSSSTVLLRTNTGNTQDGAPTGTTLCTSHTFENANAKIICNHATLAASTWYTFTIKNSVKNLGGEAINCAATNDCSGSDIAIKFQTASFSGGASFSPPPFISGTYPSGGSLMPANSKIRVSFFPGGTDPNVTTMATTGAGSVLSLDNVQLFLTSNGAPTGSNLLACANTSNDCNMSWNAANKELIITPGKKAPAGTNASTGGTALVDQSSYQLVIKNTIKNTDDIAMSASDYIVQFTATTNDTTGPTVGGTFPNDGTTGIDRATYDITVGFNESIDPATLTSSTLKVIPDTNSNDTADDTPLTNIQVRLDPDGRVAHVSPLTLLTASKKHFIQVTTGVKDSAGNAVASTITKSFTTGTNVNGAASDTTGPYVVFSEASNFGIGISYSEPLNSLDAVSSTVFRLESPEGVPLSLSGKTIEYKAYEKKTYIKGLTLPPTQSFKVTIATTTKDLAGNGFDASGSPAKNVARGTVTSAAGGGGGGSTGEQGSQFNFHTLGVEPIMIMPDAQMAGVTTQYRGEFKAATSIPNGGKIVLTFPSGFSFAAACSTKLDQFDNNDINGPSTGSITFTVACDSQARTVTLTTSGAATVANDFLRFKLQGITNSSVPKDFSTGGYTVTIKTFNTTNTLLDSLTSMPFFLATPGSQTISGFVFNDTDKDSTKDGGETGVADIKVCLGGPSVGFNCTTTGSDGSYSFGSLSNGFFHVEVPPITSGSVSAVGGFMFRDINLVGGASESGVNFGLKASDGTITVSITGGPASEKVDAFAFNPYNTSTGGHVVREVTLNGSGAGTASLPISIGKWQVSVGPWMPKDPGAPPPPPAFNFLPPQPQEVNITSGAPNATVSFSLQTTNRTIKGKVVDGSGTAIPNVFVGARPANIGFSTSGPGGGAFTQTGSDGTFNLSVINGSYLVEAHMPGMPGSEPKEVTVKDNSSGSDSNSTADVYSNGALLTGDGLTVRMAKADLSIAGRVLDASGNAIAYAFVNGEKVDSGGAFLGQFVGSPTDSSGNFTLYVSNGTWKLRAFAPGFGDLGTKTVTISGSNATDQNFQVSTNDFGTVSGTVYQDSNGNSSADAGEGLAGAFVNVSGPNGGNGTVTSSDGTYSIKVKTGSGYVVEGFVPGKGPLAPTGAFTVSLGEVTGKDLSLAGTGTINVTITGITDAFVDARDSNGRGFGTGSNTSGVYSLTLPASTSGIVYTVKAHNPKYGVVGSQAVTLTTNASEGVTFSAPTLYTISGTVSSTSAACVGSVGVFLTDTTNGRHAGASTATDGTYSVQVPNGTYVLQAGKQGCIDSANPGTVVVNGANVSSGTNRTMNAADSSITGRVTLSGSNATTKTVVFADNGSGKFVATDVDTSVTGSSNNYTLSLTAGTWTVKARSDGYESASASVTVTSGGTTTQNLTLSAISGYTVKEAKPFNVKPSQGGLVKNSDITNSAGKTFELNIPAGAFGSSANDATVSTKEKTSVVDPSSDSIDVLGDKGIEITPTDASGNKITTLSSSSGASVTVSVPYNESDIPAGVSEDKLALAVWSEEKQTWESLSTTVDTTNNILTASISHFSDFAPVAPVGSDVSAAPSTPSGVTAGSPGVNSILIRWDSVSTATSYNVYRSTSSGGTFARLGSEPTITGQSANSYTDSGLTCNTAYFYKVSAKNDSGESAASSAVTSTTLACGDGSGGGVVAGGGGGGGGGGGSTTTSSPTTSSSSQQTSQQSVQPSSQSSIQASSTVVLAEGTLVRVENSPKVYVVKNGKLLHIPNPKAFNELRMKWGEVKVVTPPAVSAVSTIILQRGFTDLKVYIVKDGKKLHIPDPKAFNKAGFKWTDILDVQKGFVENTPDMVLVRPSNSQKVYRLEKGKLRWIMTMQAFNRLKLKWDDVVVLEPNEIFYPIGTNIK